MHPPLHRLLLALCLAAGFAAAGPSHAGPIEGEAEARRTREVLAPRYLPAVASRPPTLVERLRPDFAPIAHVGESVLTQMLDLRLRQLAGPRPPDPRRRIQTGDIALRVPIGERLDLRPGMRIEYERHPVDDLWVGEPVPTLSVRVRF